MLDSSVPDGTHRGPYASFSPSLVASILPRCCRRRASRALRTRRAKTGEAWQIIPLAAVVARVRARRHAHRRDRARDADERLRFARSRSTSRRRSSPSRTSASTSTTASTSSACSARSKEDPQRESRRREHDHAAARRDTCIPTIIDRREISGTAGISRKLHEQSAAREMERHYTEGADPPGVHQPDQPRTRLVRRRGGSRHYFGHPAAQLTLAEAATLAGCRNRSRLRSDRASRARERRGAT